MIGVMSSAGSVSTPGPAISESEQALFAEVRRKHIAYEVLIRSVAVAFALSSCLWWTVASVLALSGPDPRIFPLPLFLTLSCTTIHAGDRLWHLRASGAITATLLSTLTLFGVMAVMVMVAAHGGSPLGMGVLGTTCTSVPASVLALLWSEKGRTVLAPEYARVIHATARMQYRYGLILIAAAFPLMLIWLMACLFLLTGLYD